MASLKLVGRAFIALSFFTLLSSFAIPSDAMDRGDAPNLEPYIDALDCVESNQTGNCDVSNTDDWPDNATIYRRDSDTGPTEATVKIRMEGKGDHVPNNRPVQVILMIDDTGSMSWNDPNYMRFNASKYFVDLLRIPHEVGFVIYADMLPNGKMAELRSPLTIDYAKAKQGMYGNSSGGTPMINGFQTAGDELIPKKKPGFEWAIIHLNDGCWGTGGDPQPQVDRIMGEQIRIFNIGLYPDPNSSDKAMCEPDLIKWSQQTGGQYYWAQDPQKLNQVFAAILSDMGGGSWGETSAGWPPRDGSPMVSFSLRYDIEVVAGSFKGSINYRPTKPTEIPSGNHGLKLEWQAPVKVLKLKQIWEVTFRIKSYVNGPHVLVNEVDRSLIQYDRYDGSPGGTDRIEQLWLNVSLPPARAPSMPLNLTGELSASKVWLSWSPPMNDGYTPILNYNIYRGSGPGEERYVSSTVGPETQYADAGIKIGYVFYYRVGAVNSAGEGGLSDEISVSTILPPRPPGSPTITSASGWVESVEIAWEPPTDDGWSPITSYKVYRGIDPGKGTPYQNVGPSELWFRDTWVLPGMTYYYSVSAMNVAGEGDMSNELSVVPEGPDDAPSQNGFSISVIVKDARTHEPLPYAYIRFDGEGRIRLADEWGRLTIPNVPNGRHSLKVYAIDHVTLARTMTVRGSDLEICFFLDQEEKNPDPDPTTYAFDPEPSDWWTLLALLSEVLLILFLLKRRRSKWRSRDRV